jgi:uncharacterized damage-inducible protein DinB
MEISSIKSFIDYYKSTRAITNKVINAIPKDKLNWTYMDGKFTIGDLVRHIAAIERFVFAELAAGNKASYKGCSAEITNSYESVFHFFNEMHTQSLKIFEALSNESLFKKVSFVQGKEVELRVILRHLIVHEVHHRGALCIYLNLLCKHRSN